MRRTALPVTFATAFGLAACTAADVADAVGAGPAPSAAPLAFPGAEGAGASSLGGRGGRVIKVTTLADSGPGSLRAAVEADGPRTIIFDVGGTIALASPLKLTNGRVTMAGQTAPGGGITLRNQPLVVDADDVVIRYIRARLGDTAKVEADALSIAGGRRIILDHVSASWSVDETLSAGSPGTDPEKVVRDLTVQWSIIAESLNRSAHAKGAHGYGSLLRSGFGAQMSFHHNLWAHHRARMPRPGNYNEPDVDPVGPRFDFRSNLFYNWGASYAGYNADKSSRSTYNFVDNAYLTGPSSKGAIAFDESSSGARAYFEGNSMNGAIPEDPWSLVSGEVTPGTKLAKPAEMPPIARDPAPHAAEAILTAAGASLFRDAVDERVVASVRSRTGGLIDSQSEVGGWPELPGGSPAPDADSDGMPDAWERVHGFNPALPDNNGDADGDGYTNLEEYLSDRTCPKGCSP